MTLMGDVALRLGLRVELQRIVLPEIVRCGVKFIHGGIHGHCAHITLWQTVTIINYPIVETALLFQVMFWCMV